MDASDFQRQSRQAHDRRSQVGDLGETLVAAWLTEQQWHILHRRWHCRWGELDLIALSNIPQTESKARSNSQALSTLAFVEVKARGRGNWDADGLLAITPKKQEKLWKTAELFLATFPHLAEVPCRFDVALVSHSQLPNKQSAIVLPAEAAIADSPPIRVEIGKPVYLAGYCLTLEQYICNAIG